MRNHAGFSSIDLIIFIVVVGILASGILLAFVGSMGTLYPTLTSTIVSAETAKQCAEVYIGKRRNNGYSSVSCTNPLVLPGVCAAQAGYAVSGLCIQTTVNGDNNYELVVITADSSTSKAVVAFLMGQY